MNRQPANKGTIESKAAGAESRLSAHSRAADTNSTLRTEQSGQNRPGQPFEPVTARYIKLGKNGRWATDALKEGIIPFGYSAVDHNNCLADEWDHVRHQLVAMGRTANGVGQGLRELKDFYGLPDDTLWVTIANGHLWWAFAEGPVHGIADAGSDGPSRYRQTRAGWCKTSLTGDPLSLRSLSSALTRTASYQMTICTISHEDYLLRRIRGEADPLHAEAIDLRAKMLDIGLRMIRQLDWRDFETLVDLIFARGGWQRSSVLGKDQADVDLILTQPTIGETAWVQIKSKTTQAELNDYLGRFRRDGSYDRFFFVCHSAAGTLSLPPERGLHLWSDSGLSQAAIDAGLYSWLTDRSR